MSAGEGRKALWAGREQYCWQLSVCDALLPEKAADESVLQVLGREWWFWRESAGTKGKLVPGALLLEEEAADQLVLQILVQEQGLLRGVEGELAQDTLLMEYAADKLFLWVLGREQGCRRVSVGADHQLVLRASLPEEAADELVALAPLLEMADELDSWVLGWAQRLADVVSLRCILGRQGERGRASVAVNHELVAWVPVMKEKGAGWVGLCVAEQVSTLVKLSSDILPELYNGGERASIISETW